MHYVRQLYQPTFRLVQVLLWDLMGRETERQGQKEKRGEGSSLSPINIIIWELKMGSFSRTLIYCQEKSMRTRGRDEKKESSGEKVMEHKDIIRASCESVFCIEHLLYHLLHEMRSLSLDMCVAEPD